MAREKMRRLGIKETGKEGKRTKNRAEEGKGKWEERGKQGEGESRGRCWAGQIKDRARHGRAEPGERMGKDEFRN